MVYVRIVFALVIVSLVTPLSALADVDPNEPVDYDRVFGPFDRVEQGAPDCDEPLAERPCVAWSYYRFQGTPFAYTAHSTRSGDGATIYLGLNSIPDPKLTGDSGRPLTVHAVDAATGAELWVSQIDHHDQPMPTDMVLSDDGDMLAFSAYLRDRNTCAAYAIDTRSGAELWSYKVPAHYDCRGIDITPDGSRVVLVGDARDVDNHHLPFYHALDATDGSKIGEAYWRFGYQSHQDVLALDNGSVYVTGEASAGRGGGNFVFLTHFVDDVLAWEARLAGTNWPTSDGRQPLLSPDGSTIYFGDHQTTGAVDAVTGSVQWAGPLPADDITGLPDLVLSPDGSQLVALDAERLRVLDPLTGAAAWSLPHNASRVPRDAAFSAGGSTLFVLFDREESVETYDAATGAHLGGIEVDGGTPSRVFPTDNGFVVTTVNGGLMSQGVHIASYVV